MLSQVLLLDNKISESQQVLLKAASINSELSSISRNHARLLLKQSKPKEALEKAQSGYDSKKCQLGPQTAVGRRTVRVRG